MDRVYNEGFEEEIEKYFNSEKHSCESCRHYTSSDLLQN